MCKKPQKANKSGQLLLDLQVATSIIAVVVLSHSPEVVITAAQQVEGSNCTQPCVEDEAALCMPALGQQLLAWKALVAQLLRLCLNPILQQHHMHASTSLLTQHRTCCVSCLSYNCMASVSVMGILALQPWQKTCCSSAC